VSVILSTRSLKVLSGVGAVAVCGVSGLLVAADPRPASAPLRPPVNGSSSSTASLDIPPSCGSASLDPSLLPIVQQLRQATTASARRTVLAALSPTQRLEIQAYLRATGRTSTGATTSCDNPSAGDSIAPSVVEAPASTQPLINTYVS
jgi:hypothetical protein